MTEIERLCRIARKVHVLEGGTLSDRDITAYIDATWQRELPLIRKILTAMREPTEGMERAAYAADELVSMPGEAWRAMIDKLLEEK